MRYRIAFDCQIRFGSDDARNGLALCKRHHWAFDGGLFGVSDTLTVQVPKHVAVFPENSSLKALAGKPLKTPENSAMAPHPEAIAWHRQNVLLRE